MTQLLGWFTRRIVGHQLEEPERQPYVSEEVHQHLAPPPFLLGSSGKSPTTVGYFALVDYKVPARVFIKNGIQTGRNPLLPNCVGRAGRKPIYDVNGPLQFMDDILIYTDRGLREVTTEKVGKLKGYPSSWGTTAKDRRWIIQEPSLHLWSVLGDAFAPTKRNQI
jgi:hypothetical protein